MVTTLEKVSIVVITPIEGDSIEGVQLMHNIADGVLHRFEEKMNMIGMRQ